MLTPTPVPTAISTPYDWIMPAITLFGPLLLGAIAIWQDKIRQCISKPKLNAVFEPKLDAIKTKYRIITGKKEPSEKQEDEKPQIAVTKEGLREKEVPTGQSITVASSGQPIVSGPAAKYITVTSGSKIQNVVFGLADQTELFYEIEETDAYYFRLRIENKGNTKAENVEVFAAKLEQLCNGEFEPVNSFLPMNLKWSHVDWMFFPAISPHTYKHCDLAHIINPEKRYHVDLEDKSFDNVGPEKTLVSFDTFIQSYTKNYLICPGTYRLLLIIAAANSNSNEQWVRIIFNEGYWIDDEQEMLKKGIRIELEK